ncbi:MAG: glycosyltransferase involved in cell wall biosynthesis [Glaciecola sp.]|jgi:glycosyltransferase involved in cell wall biosynthesis
MAGYLISNLKSLVSKGYDVVIYHWPVNVEAPFIFEEVKGVTYKDRSLFTKEKLQNDLFELQPKAIICSGWMDKGYLRVIKSFKKKIPTIIALDNHWTGSIKQRLMQVASPLILKRIFNYAWVAGEPQALYARKLGFSGQALLDGFYSADISFFTQQYEQNKEAKKVSFPKVFLFVGRYIKQKGIYEMWDAFIALKKEHPNDWKLWCAGAGDDFDKRIEHPDIKHFGFVQPSEMARIIRQSGVFILPSHFEPWGVVVHEFASAGMPLLLSEEIGSASAFLKAGENGELFRAKSVDEIKNVMIKTMSTSNDELNLMSEKSQKLSDWIDSDKWCEKLINLL